MSDFRRITPELLEEIRNQWENAAGEDAFAAELERFFTGVRTGLTTSDQLHSPLHYALYDPSPGDTRDECGAILELVAAKQWRMTKLLTITLSPALWNWGDDQELRDRVRIVYTAAIARMIALGEIKAEAKTHDVKIYGRNDTLLDMLKTVAAGWDIVSAVQEDFESSATMEGRWLKITITSATR